MPAAPHLATTAVPTTPDVQHSQSAAASALIDASVFAATSVDGAFASTRGADKRPVLLVTVAVLDWILVPQGVAAPVHQITATFVCSASVHVAFCTPRPPHCAVPVPADVIVGTAFEAP